MQTEYLNAPDKHLQTGMCIKTVPQATPRRVDDSPSKVAA